MKYQKRNKLGQFISGRHFKWVGIAYLIFVFTLLLMGSRFSYEFISPLASNQDWTRVNYIRRVEKKDTIRLKVSHYWPELGGTNCGNFVDGVCTSRMANGERWQDHVGVAIACPKELEFGTRIKVSGRVWECKDRGGKITKEGDVYWIDMLLPYSLTPYGSILVGERL